MLSLSRYALGCVTVLLLAACGDGVVRSTVPVPIALDSAFPYHKTFLCTGRPQSFTVPPGVTQIKALVRGARGGSKDRHKGGRGGDVIAFIPVTPDEKLVVFVGAHPSDARGGFNGGGAGGDKYCQYGWCGYGGGGASDIRQGGDKLTDRIIVAGGGGGAGGLGIGYSDDAPGAGGVGGGRVGGSGKSARSGSSAYEVGGGGAGGTQDNGGAGGKGGVSGGPPGQNGSRGRGGAGGSGCDVSSCGANGYGGGGGGGYYGGGGGGAGSGTESYGDDGGGGGGGSSYIAPRAKTIRDARGWRNALGDGLVVLSWQ